MLLGWKKQWIRSYPYSISACCCTCKSQCVLIHCWCRESQQISKIPWRNLHYQQFSPSKWVFLNLSNTSSHWLEIVWQFIRSILIFSTCTGNANWVILVAERSKYLQHSGSVLDHRSLSPVFESRRGHIWRLFHLWLRFSTFGGRSAHLAYLVHKSGRKTSFIIIIIIFQHNLSALDVFQYVNALINK